MALNDLLKAPLDTSQADAQTFMERIQGNILKGHDRYHSAESNDFVKTGVGPNATLGNNSTRLAQQWPLDGKPAAKDFLTTNFVTMLGGEYFFAPSPQFLGSL